MDRASDRQPYRYINDLYSSDPRIALDAWRQYADRDLEVVGEIEKAIATNNNFKAIAFILGKDCRDKGCDSPDWFAIVCYIASGVYRIEEAKASAESDKTDGY
jgi:hypothetical protein